MTWPDCGGIVDCVDHWQILLAGLLGFGAAIWTVRVTLRSEYRRHTRELDSIRKSLGSEVRQFALRALEGHSACKILATGPGNFTLAQIEDAGRFVDPVIYPNVADKLGYFGDEAHHFVLFYNQIDVFRNALARLRSHPTPDGIEPINAKGGAEALLKAAETALLLLPITRVGNYYTKRDEKFSKAVETARAASENLSNETSARVHTAVSGVGT